MFIFSNRILDNGGCILVNVSCKYDNAIHSGRSNTRWAFHLFEYHACLSISPLSIIVNGQSFRKGYNSSHECLYNPQFQSSSDRICLFSEPGLLTWVYPCESKCKCYFYPQRSEHQPYMIVVSTYWMMSFVNLSHDGQDTPHSMYPYQSLNS